MSNGFMPDEYSVRPTEVPLEKVLLRSNYRFDKSHFCAHDAKIRIFDEAPYYLAAQLDAYVTTQRLKEREVTATVSIERYTTWWDMFKATYFPKWLQKHFPVDKREFTNSNTVRYTALACYPDFLMKDQRHYFVFMEEMFPTCQRNPRG